MIIDFAMNCPFLVGTSISHCSSVLQAVQTSCPGAEDSRIIGQSKFSTDTETIISLIPGVGRCKIKEVRKRKKRKRGSRLRKLKPSLVNGLGNPT